VPGANATSRFIDPKTLAALGDLTLAARTVVDGFMYGVHQSRMPGAGLEFSQYRSYQPGDDLRRVDWKLFARSDRYFLRDAETDTSVVVRLVLDASESMAQEEDGLSKFDYARMLVAALALLARRQGDAVGLYPVAGPPGPVEPPRRQHQHLDRLLHVLERLAPAGAWPAWEELEGLFTAGGQRGIVVVVTDLHQRHDEIQTLATKLAALRHEVLLLHVVGRAELEFPYHGVVTLEELETGRRIEVDADQVRATYLAAQERALVALRRALDDQRVDYARFRLDQPLDAALRQYLATRARRH
jgi:uncharacterized protein (DUF58 family)